MRREYWLQIFINGRRFKRVLIDDHYEQGHRTSMTDALMIDLIKNLAGQDFRPELVRPSGFSIFVTEPLWFEGKPYRLVWTTHPDKDYIGVINAFRRRYGKKEEADNQ